MGPLGWQETIFIFILALLIFGPKKLPELGRTIGKAMTEFRRASSELRSTFDREMSNIERETNLQEISTSIQTETRIDDASLSSSNYDYNYDYDYGAYGEDPYNSSAPAATDAAAISANEQAALPAGSQDGGAAPAETDTSVTADDSAAVETQPAVNGSDATRHEALAAAGTSSDSKPSGHPA